MNYPEMVRPNHRYRGPMESNKDNNAAQDIHSSIEILKKQFQKNDDNIRGSRSKVFYFFNEEIPAARKEVVLGVSTVRGGEL